MTHFHAVLWLDHREARIIYFNVDSHEETVIHPAHDPRHLHEKAGSAGGQHLHGEPEYFDRIIAALTPAGAFMITGPSTAKTELVAYMQKHAPQVCKRLDEVETLAKVTDKQLLAEARRHFKVSDHMTAQVRKPTGGH